MGRACAARLAGRPGTLFLTDLNQAGLESVAGQLRAQRSDRVETRVLDLANPDEVKTLVGAVRDDGGLDCLIGAAGLAPTMSDWKTIFAVNLVANAILVAGLADAVGVGSAAVLMSSIAAHRMAEFDDEYGITDIIGDPLAPDIFERLEATPVNWENESYLAYAWSKVGVIRLAAGAAEPWARHGARICSLSPGMIETPMGKYSEERFPHMAELVTRTPMKRKGTVDEITGAVDFLLSPAASFITGTDLLVDGGVSGAGMGTPPTNYAGRA